MKREILFLLLVFFLLTMCTLPAGAFSISRLEIIPIQISGTGMTTMESGLRYDIMRSSGLNLHLKVMGVYPVFDYYGLKAQAGLSFFLSKEYGRRYYYTTRYRYGRIYRIRFIDTFADFGFLDVGVRYHLMAGEIYSYGDYYPVNFKDLIIFSGYRFLSLRKTDMLGMRSVELHAYALIGLPNRQDPPWADAPGDVIPGFRVGINWFTLTLNLGYYEEFIVDFAARLQFSYF